MAELEEVIEHIEERRESLRDSIKDDVASVKSSIEDRRDSIEDRRESLKESAEDRRESLRESVEDRRESLRESAEDRRESLKELAEDRRESVKELEEERREELEEAIERRESLHELENDVKKELRDNINEAYAKNELKEEILVNKLAEEVVEGVIEKQLSEESLVSKAEHSVFNSEAHLVHDSNVEIGHPTIKEKKFKPIVLSIIICMGSFAMGAVIGYPSPAVPDMKKFNLSSDQSSWVGSIITLAALLGALVGGVVMDKVGRRLGIMLSAVPLAIGWVIIVSSPNYGCLLAGRAVTGAAMGVISIICPVYIGEVSPPSIRGILGSCHQLFICIGILYTYCFGYFLSWQWLGIACLAFLFVLVFGLCLVVESPRYLLSVGKKEECKEALVWLRGEDVDITYELKELERSIENSKDQAKLSEFIEPHLWKPLAISLGLMIFQQFSGINVIMFYTVDIFTMANLSMDPNVQTIIVGVVGIVGTCVSVAVSDIVGRRILLLASATIMALSMAGMGAFFYELIIVNDNVTPDSLTWLPVTCLVLFNFGFDVAYGPIPWLMMGELFPLRAKALAGSISTALNWLCAFLMTKFWVNMTDAMGVAGGYWFCMGICCVSIIFIIFFVPETKGKSLEEIEGDFKKSGNIFCGFK